MERLRIIFMGTAELACASLEALTQQTDFSVVAVVTQPDRPKGRDLKLQPSPVKQVALKHALPVLQPERARNPEFVQSLAEFKPDLIVVAAYGQILPKSILELPRFGCLNVHTSLLPKYRGAAPIQWAILDGEPVTGVTIMKMDAGLDTGDILTQETTPIQHEDNSQLLHDRLAQIGAALLVPTIREFVSGKIIARPQPVEGVSYARKILKEDGKLDWTQPAHVLWNRVRGFTPWPGAFTHLPAEPKPLLLKIWQAEVIEGASGNPGEILSADKTGIIIACGEKALKVTTLQREGGRRMNAQDFLTGHSLKPGQKLG
ncbi:methionyl-tRNA formyltransferase [Pedosphaera parvula]|uniref:Methionyl-tRNA formyltransferase n=1 Tax=Pedosphaera parvula (strain Ellin514) TaxID=320771 RepID=B9XIU7_PEDPL|nr:methionyl-tRNA formyltransferase [Pedosphaera parvula]EEF60174.1 methionyl-tRNA formyltransferase [Pedosphaera parvula Ellin514]